MAASQSGVFSLQEFSDIGAPLVGGRLYTYVYGTTTHKTAYTDKAGTIPHTYTSDGIGGQYIALNARGELPAPLYLAAGSYDIALKDASGATIWTRRADPGDDSTAALALDLASTSGASLMGWIRAASGAVGYALGTWLGWQRPNVLEFMTTAQRIDYLAGTFTLDHTAAVQAAVNSSVDLDFPPGGLNLASGEVLIDKSIRLNFSPSNEYDSAGTIIRVAHNNAALSGLNVGSVSSTIRFEITGTPTFTAPVSSGAAFAGLKCQAATVFIDGVRSTRYINGFYFNNNYIGEVAKLSGQGANYLLKVAGDTSLNFRNINIGQSFGGLAAMQLTHSAGHVTVDKLYLEAQALRNLAITTTASAATTLRNVYGENSVYYDISIAGSTNVTIENYATNTNTKSILITNSNNIKINNISARSVLEAYEVVNIDDASYGIYVGGILLDTAESRIYAMVRGPIDGQPAPSIVNNPTLALSANGTTSTVGGSGVIADAPTQTALRFSPNSIQVNAANPLKLPFVRWRNGRTVVISLVYKQTSAFAASNDVGLWIYKGGTTVLWSIQDFNISNTGNWNVLHIVTTLPATDTLDQYSSLEFRCSGAHTAEVHYLDMHFYDGGMLPFGTVDESVVFESAPVTIGSGTPSAVLVPKVGGKNFRLKSYELVYDTGSSGSGSAGTVAFGDANTSGGLASAYCNFTTAINQGMGLPSSALAAAGPYPFRDHWLNTPNGWCVSVTSAGTITGAVRGYIRATPIDTNAGG